MKKILSEPTIIRGDNHECTKVNCGYCMAKQGKRHAMSGLFVFEKENTQELEQILHRARRKLFKKAVVPKDLGYYR